MKAPALTTRSLRTVRVQARLPRILAAVLVLILSASGLRTIIVGPPRPAPARTIVASESDQAAASFAEGFARAYLAWDTERPDMREQTLAPFVGAALDADAGLRPASGTSQRVSWTSVLGSRRIGERQLVTVAAQTTHGLTYLNVPVTRNDRGFLSIAGYPAIVGPPATDRDTNGTQREESVEDDALTTVVSRALTNYLVANEGNLLADLTPDAVISLPPRALAVSGVGDITWVRPGRRVAATVDATDDDENAWTLRYELDVLKRDRWYVRSLQINPTFQGGT